MHKFREGSAMIRFFDSNCGIGMRSVRRFGLPGEGEFYSVESLLSEMDRSSIDKALVYHFLAREYHPATGNKKLMDEIKGCKRLYPCWVIMPHATGEMPGPETIVDEMIKQGVKAVRLFPSDHLYSLSDWCSGQMLKALEQRRIVLIIEIDQIGWEGINSLCSRYPSLPIIVANLNYRVNRQLYPLLERYENVYIETSGYQVHKGVEDVCSRFGAKRLIFGTRLPYFTPGPAMTLIWYSLIDMREKSLIAGENLKRLLGINSEDIKGEAQRNLWMPELPVKGELIIDAHTHMGPYFNFHIPDNSDSGMISVMDRLGISVACTSPHAGITADFKLGNDITIQAMHNYPGRFWGYITINPNYPELIAEELERCYSAGMRGIKLHPSLHSYPADGKNLRPVWEYAEQRAMPVLVHTWYGTRECSPRMFDRLADEYPSVNILLGHSGGTLEGFDEAIEVAKRHENVFLETCCSSVFYGQVERFVREVGAEKIIYGSDMPFVNANAQIGKILYAKISDEERRLILGLNMARIMREATQRLDS